MAVKLYQWIGRGVKPPRLTAGVGGL